MVRRTLRILTVRGELRLSVVVRSLSPHSPRLSDVCGGGGGGMSDAYQVLMADTQRGRPPGPPGPASRVCVCYAVTEARGRPCLLLTGLLFNYVRPVLKIADMSSFYARAYVNLVLLLLPLAHLTL